MHHHEYKRQGVCALESKESIKKLILATARHIRLCIDGLHKLKHVVESGGSDVGRRNCLCKSVYYS